MQIQTTTTAKMPLKRDFVALPPAIGDRITFATPDDGLLAGFVSALRPHLGNGEVFAWVELDESWAGTFRGVPLRDIQSSDGFGRYLSQTVTPDDFKRLYLCDFSNVARVPARERPEAIYE